jgi:hypothetical protein
MSYPVLITHSPTAHRLNEGVRLDATDYQLRRDAALDKNNQRKLP